MVSQAGARRLEPREICFSDEQTMVISQSRRLVAPSFLPSGRGDTVSRPTKEISWIRYRAPRILGMETGAGLPRICARLPALGLPDRDLTMIMGGNFLRVFGDAVRT